MDIKSIIEKLESAPQELKNMVFTMLTNTAIAASNAEKETFQVNDIGGYKNEVNAHVSQEVNEHSIRGIINDMKEGVINENTIAFKKRYTDILKLADEYSEKMNGHLYYSNRYSEQNETARLLKEQHENSKNFDFNVINRKTCTNEHDVQFNKVPPVYAYTTNFKSSDNNTSSYLTQSCKNIKGIDKGNKHFILYASFLKPVNLSQVNSIQVIGMVVQYNKEFFTIKNVKLLDTYNIEVTAIQM